MLPLRRGGAQRKPGIAASTDPIRVISRSRVASPVTNLPGGALSNAAALPAHQVLRMATLNGARALGMADETGSLVAGKWADMAAVDLETLETQPLYDPVSQLVYAASRSQISDVWVAGQQLLRKRELTQLDTRELMQRTHGWQQRIAAGDSGA